MKVLVTLPSFTEEAKPILAPLGDVRYNIPSQEALDAAIGEYDALVVGLGLTFKRTTLEKATKLKVLATATTGLDHIDLEFAKTRDITVLSLKGENEFLDTITGTAELAFALMLNLLRKIPQAHKDVIENGRWEREKFRGTSLYGKTLGIIGMGRLGKIMAQGAEGFRMNVGFFDPHIAAEAFPNFKKISLDELLATSDVVAVHVHLTPETEYMVNESALKKMKRGALLINTARGKIVDEHAVLKALEAGTLSGYGADVLEGELAFGVDASGDPLVEYAKHNDHVIIVPHIGGMTTDSRAATDMFIAKKTAAFLAKHV